jgi:WD40 repeat protein
MIRCRPLACLLTLLIAGACARRTEIIGRLPDGAVADGPGDLPPGLEMGGGTSGNGGDAGDGTPFGCPAPPPLPLVSTPTWTCDGRARCLRDPLLDAAVFAAVSAATEDPDITQRPAIVYPLAGSVHPMNLPRITVQWNRATTNQTAFRIRLQLPGDDTSAIDLYVPHVVPFSTPAPVQPEDAIYELPETLWRYVAWENAGRELAITVSAYNSLSNRIATSSPRTIRFSPAPLEGGLYYLSLEVTRGIKRYLFGAREASVIVPPTPEVDCAGCHSLSRDGAIMAFSAKYAGSLTVAPTANLMAPTLAPRPPPDERNGIAPAVSPNGQYVVSRDGGDDSFRVYDARSGVQLSMATTADTDGRVDFPEWSPNGRELVSTLARGTQPMDPQSANDGRVAILPIAGGRVGRPVVIAAEADQVHAHPSWSPDGQWIVFVSVPRGQETRRNPMTRLRLVNRAGGTIHTLGQATQMMVGRASTYPKFAPAPQQDCSLLFITFHSRINYGVVRRNDLVPTGGSAQLWMAAIDLGRLPAFGQGSEVDPSSAPVWLPIQDVRDQNVLAAWSDQIPCGADCGPGGRCDQGRCVAIPP